MDDFGNVVVFVIIVVVMIFRGLKRLADSGADRPRSTGGAKQDEWDEWEEWTPTAKPTTPKPALRPVVQQQPRPVGVPQPRPVATPVQIKPATVTRSTTVAAPAPVVMARPQSAPAGMKVARPAETKPAPQMEYSAPAPRPMQPPKQHLPPARPPGAAALQATLEVVGTSMSAVFADATRKTRRAPKQAKRKIRVNARDRRTLRQAVLLREVIARPRCFDI